MVSLVKAAKLGTPESNSLLEPYTCMMDSMLWRMRPRSKEWGPVWWRLGTCLMKTGDMFDEDWGQQTPGGTLFLGTVPKIHHIWWEYEQNSSSFYQVFYFKWLIMNLQLSLLSSPILPNGTTCFQHNTHILMGTINKPFPARKVARSWWNSAQLCGQIVTQGGATGLKRS